MVNLQHIQKPSHTVAQTLGHRVNQAAHWGAKHIVQITATIGLTAAAVAAYLKVDFIAVAAFCALNIVPLSIGLGITAGALAIMTIAVYTFRKMKQRKIQLSQPQLPPLQTPLLLPRPSLQQQPPTPMETRRQPARAVKNRSAPSGDLGAAAAPAATTVVTPAPVDPPRARRRQPVAPPTASPVVTAAPVVVTPTPETHPAAKKKKARSTEVAPPVEPSGAARTRRQTREQTAREESSHQEDAPIESPVAKPAVPAKGAAAKKRKEKSAQVDSSEAPRTRRQTRQQAAREESSHQQDASIEPPVAVPVVESPKHEDTSQQTTREKAVSQKAAAASPAVVAPVVVASTTVVLQAPAQGNTAAPVVVQEERTERQQSQAAPVAPVVTATPATKLVSAPASILQSPPLSVNGLGSGTIEIRGRAPILLNTPAHGQPAAPEPTRTALAQGAPTSTITGPARPPILTSRRPSLHGQIDAAPAPGVNRVPGQRGEAPVKQQSWLEWLGWQ